MTAVSGVLYVVSEREKERKTARETTVLTFSRGACHPPHDNFVGGSHQNTIDPTPCCHILCNLEQRRAISFVLLTLASSKPNYFPDFASVGVVLHAQNSTYGFAAVPRHQLQDHGAAIIVL